MLAQGSCSAGSGRDEGVRAVGRRSIIALQSIQGFGGFNWQSPNPPSNTQPSQQYSTSERGLCPIATPQSTEIPFWRTPVLPLALALSLAENPLNHCPVARLLSLAASLSAGAGNGCLAFAWLCCCSQFGGFCWLTPCFALAPLLVRIWQIAPHLPPHDFISQRDLRLFAQLAFNRSTLKFLHPPDRFVATQTLEYVISRFHAVTAY